LKHIAGTDKAKIPDSLRNGGGTTSAEGDNEDSAWMKTRLIQPILIDPSAQIAPGSYNLF
jgi:hypothetical protein